VGLANRCPHLPNSHRMSGLLTLESGNMNSSSWRTWLGAAAISLAAFCPAHANVVTFDDAPTGLDSIFEDGQTFVSGGFRFAPTALFLPAVPGTLVGAISDAASMLFGAPPTNADGRFYAGYNDGGVTMTTGSDRALFVDGFDAAFVPFVPGFYAEGSFAGLLVAFYEEFNSAASGFEVFDLAAADANGEFETVTITGAGLGALQDRALASVTFFACVFEGVSCFNPSTFNDAWFALDNISARVPEPPTWLLVASLLGLLVARRRVSR